VDDGVLVAGNIKNDVFKEEDIRFPTNDVGIIAVLLVLDKTGDVF
jgi:hypothetical protein